MYVPLHWHSTFSFLEALGHPKDIIQRAKELWYSSIAITDYNWMFWIPAFFQASQDSKNPDDENDQWVKSIFWTEIWFVMDINASLIWKNIWNLCLIAENDQWYHNMMELVAFANQQWYSNWIPKLDVNALKEKSEWIIIFAWGEQSWMSKLVASWESEVRIREIYEMLQDIFGDRCYLEITAQDEQVLSVTKKCNQFVGNLAKKTNTKLIVNNDFRYLREEDKHTREIALAIKDWAKMYDLNRRRPAGKYHIMDSEEIRNICLKNWYDASEVDEWMENNWKIAEMANASMLLHQKLFPRYNIPDHVMALYDEYWADAIIDED